MGQLTLRISIQESDRTIGVVLEGRIAGPWVAELRRAWTELIPRLGGKKFKLDLRNVTYSDAGGKLMLREIFDRTQADLLTSTPWTQYLAEEIRTSNGRREEAERGSNA